MIRIDNTQKRLISSKWAFYWISILTKWYVFKFSWSYHQQRQNLTTGAPEAVKGTEFADAFRLQWVKAALPPATAAKSSTSVYADAAEHNMTNTDV